MKDISNNIKTDFDLKTVLMIIMPMIIEQILNLSVGFADSVMVSELGEEAIAAVSLMDNIYLLMIYIFTALGTGGAIVTGQYIGAKKMNQASESATELIKGCAIIGICIFFLLITFQTLILHKLFGTISGRVLLYARIYFKIVTLSIPFIAVYQAAASIFRAIGNTKIITLTAFSVGVVNVIGNALGIYFFKVGISGVAVPTVCSRFLGMVLLLYFLLRKQNFLKIELKKKININIEMMKRILKIGIPSSIENGMFQLGKVILLGTVSSLGTTAISANSIAGLLAAIKSIPGDCIGIACIIFISRTSGEGNIKKTRSYIWKLLKMDYVATIAVSGIFLILLPFLLNMYHLSEETYRLTHTLVLLHTFVSFIVWPPSFMLPQALKAKGDAYYTMMVSVLSMLFVRIGLGYIMGIILGYGLLGIWIAMFCDWLVRCICFLKRACFGK